MSGGSQAGLLRLCPPQPAEAEPRQAGCDPKPRRIPADDGVHMAKATTDALLAQILVKQGKHGRQLAVIKRQLRAVTDHEHRLRKLEQFRYLVVGASLAGSALGTWLGAMAVRR